MHKCYFRFSKFSSIKKHISIALFLLMYFFAQYTLNAQSLQWAKRLGGAGFDASYSIAVDDDGNVYTIGLFTDTVDFDPGPGTVRMGEAEQLNTYVSKSDANGNLIWAKQLGNYQNVSGLAVVVDSLKNVFIAGQFLEFVDFDPDPFIGSLIAASSGFYDAFILKLDSYGNFVWAKGFGDVQDDYINSLALDAKGNVYFTGIFSKSVDFDPDSNVYILSTAGDDDVHICKLSNDGEFRWARSIGGLQNDNAHSISVDALGNTYVIGEYRATADLNSDLFVELHTATDSGLDMFILKLDSAGNFIWAKSIGGKDAEYGMAIKADNAGNLYIAGTFKDSVDFDPGPGMNMLYEPGVGDIFISRFDTSGNLVWVRQIGAAQFDVALSIDVDANGNIYTTGYFSSSADFDPGPGSFILNTGSIYNTDAFISKLDYNGNFVWAERIGGNGHDYGRSIKVDAAGTIYSCGFYENIISFHSSPSTQLLCAGRSDSYSVKYSSSTASVSDQPFGTFLKIYPVPAADKLTMEFNPAIKYLDLEIHNVLGASVYKETIVNAHLKTIDISGFGPGIYLLRLSDGSKFYTGKFVKE